MCYVFSGFFENYLLNRRQRVILNDKESNWTNLNAGVPRDLYWACCFSLFILMILLVRYLLACVYLLMVLPYLRVSKELTKLT